MADRIPLVLGSIIPGGRVSDISRAEFDALVVRVDWIEANAVDQADFDALVDRVTALENANVSLRDRLENLLKPNKPKSHHDT